MEQNFETEVLVRLGIIEEKLDGYSKNKEKAELAYTVSQENKKAIEEIKENNKWLIRTIAGSLIGIVIEAIVLIIKLN